MAAARKKRSSTRPRRKSKQRDEQPAGGPVWEPSAVPARHPDGTDAPSLAEEQERTFHATHFSADPRGSSMAGSPPPDGSFHKHRGGTPPPAPGSIEQEEPAPRQKHRGGTPPPRSGPADV